MWLPPTWSYYREFLSFSHMTFKLNILSNHAEHPKGLVSYYVLPLFTKNKKKKKVKTINIY